jgi:hypothetical protein
MGKRDRSAADVAELIRRTVGFMAAVVAEAEKHDLPVPPAVESCVDLWRGWFRSMDRQAGEGR